MSLLPIYVYEEGSELPDVGTYFVVAANGMFMHKDVGTVKALVRFDLEKVPLLQDFVPPKPKSVPVYIFDADCGDLPEDEEYFVVAKNGVMRHTSHQAAKDFIRANFGDIPNLGHLQTKVRFELPKIPVEIMWRCLLFFRRVWYVHHAEAAVILFYNKEKQEYFLHAPRQQVAGGGVDYGTLGRGVPDPAEVRYVSEMRQKGFSRVGTIHSHCNFNAYHSPVDTGDEAEWPDGVHITIGHVDNAKAFSLMSSLVVNNNRFLVDPTSIINGLKEKRAKKVMGFAAVHGDNFYDVTLTTDEREALIGLYQHEIEEEWLPKVEQRNFNTNANWYQNTAYGRKNQPETHVSACVAPAVALPTPTGGVADVVEAMTQHGVVQATTENPPVVEATDAEVPRPEVEEIVGEEPAKTIEEGRFLRKVRSHALALRTHGDTIPEDRKTKLTSTLQHFFRRSDITDADIKLAAQVNPKYPAYYEKKGYAIQ